MGMAGQIVRADEGDIRVGHRGQPPQHGGGRGAPVSHGHRPCHGVHPGRGNGPVHDLGPGPGHGEQPRISPGQIDQVQHIFQQEGVIHRATLEVPAIRHDLLRQLPPQQPLAQCQPRRWLPRHGARRPLQPNEKGPGEDQGLGIGEQMIAQQVIFQPPAQPARLDGQAVLALRGQCPRPLCQRPLDPVDDAQRGRIGLPAIANPRRVLVHPTQ